ncbi:MAG: dicarboxylate/amino acid:cation symporter [Bacteroidetes bacterium]|nr:dicarboxylate/amino acid:cation symporter [Bacteroidota bacterium]
MRFKNLTTVIFVAMFLGIFTGYLLNISKVGAIVRNIDDTEQNIQVLLKDSAASDSLGALAFHPKIAAFKKSKALFEKEKNSALLFYQMLSTIFLRLIKMIIAPLVFCILIVGIAKLGDVKQVGRIGGKALGWFVFASLISLFLGMLLVNVFHPGKLIKMEKPAMGAETGIRASAMNAQDFITHIFPENIFDALAKNEILQIVIFAVLFGFALAALKEKGKNLVSALDTAAHVMLKITSYIMYVAPLAVFGAMAAAVAVLGINVLNKFAVYILSFYASLGLLWGVLLFFGFLAVGKRVISLLRHIRQPIILAFSTSSSEAAMPKTIEQLNRFGCPENITGFVLPLGYSFNLDGSMMYMTFASISIGHIYGIDLSFQQQLSMLLMLMVTSKGIAGVPRASLVVITAMLGNFGIPTEGILLFIGIDQILDMGRSATNVVGNAVATVIVSKWEGAFKTESKH